MSRSKPRVSERLAAVTSPAELHALLCELAADPKSRWTRTQVLFYLPCSLHAVAEDYFRGEHLVIPDRRTSQVEPVDTVALEAALAELEELARTFPPEEAQPERIQPPLLRDMAPSPPAGAAETLDNVIWAVFNEAQTVDRSAPKRFRLKDGRCVGIQGESFVYVFKWSSDPEPYMPGQLGIGTKRFRVRVGNQGEEKRTFELLTEEYVGPEVPDASFWIDPTFQLRVQLHWLQHFRSRAEAGEAILTALSQPPQAVLETADHGVNGAPGLNVKQKEALNAARLARISYVWGPPGTGKTTTLGALIRDRVDAGERVLVLSPYNVAVDQAVESAARRGKWRPGQIVRFGRVSERVRDLRLDVDSVLEAHADATGLLRAARRLHSAVTRTYDHERPTPATVRRCLEELGEVVVRVGRSARPQAPQAARIMDGIRLLRRLYRSPEPRVLRDASVVATTVALSQLSPLIHGNRFDRVIIDEASVVRTPEAILAALMFEAPVTFFGDPMQLPSVVRSRTPEADRWLRPNPFQMAGIRGPEHARGACVMLDEQHRMATPIRKLVSDLFYGGALKDARETDGRILLLDTSATPARATTRWVRMSQSRENQVHRDIVASLLEVVKRDRPDATVLIVAPFRAQARLYAREANTNRFRRVRFETVHSSQGIEADTVILDLVVAPSRGRSRFLDEGYTPELRNLLNVGISRAKRQLILVVHGEEVERQYAGGLLPELLRRAESLGHRIVLPADLRLQSVWKQVFGLNGGIRRAPHVST